MAATSSSVSGYQVFEFRFSSYMQVHFHDQSNQ